MVQAQVALDQHVDPLRGSLSVNGHAVSVVQRQEAAMSIVALISNPALEFNHTDSSTTPPQKAMSVATLVCGPSLECSLMSSSANAQESNLSPNFVGSASFGPRESPVAPGRPHAHRC